MKPSKPIVQIVCFGDSITAGGWPEEMNRLLAQREDFWFEAVNYGICGDTTALALQTLYEGMPKFLPSVVMIEFGINDCNVRPAGRKARVGLEEFRDNLMEFHRFITKAGGSCIFLVNHIIRSHPGVSQVQGNGLSFEQNLAPYNQAIREVARQTNAPVIDLPEEIKKSGVELDRFLRIDGLHLTEYGNREYARMVYQGFCAIWEERPDIRVVFEQAGDTLR